MNYKLIISDNDNNNAIENNNNITVSVVDITNTTQSNTTTTTSLSAGLKRRQSIGGNLGMSISSMRTSEFDQRFIIQI